MLVLDNIKETMTILQDDENNFEPKLAQVTVTTFILFWTIIFSILS
jgi:hypothetical protein